MARAESINDVLALGPGAREGVRRDLSCGRVGCSLSVLDDCVVWNGHAPQAGHPLSVVSLIISARLRRQCSSSRHNVAMLQRTRGLPCRMGLQQPLVDRSTCLNQISQNRCGESDMVGATLCHRCSICVSHDVAFFWRIQQLP